MIKALAIKELREVLGIAFLGLGTHLFLVLCRIGTMPFTPLLPFHDYDVPFVDGKYDKMSGAIAFVLAIALGFRQSAWEAGRGTYLFLLHRPIHREAVFLTKLAVGCVVFLVCMGLPVLVLAIWAAIPGTHPNPFEWSMTSWSWRMCLVVLLVYAGAFLSGLRRARWFGTRVLPVVAAGAIAIFLLVVPWLWLLGLPLLFVLYALLTANICYVARMRDFS